ncbi:MAG: hypothetical protein QMC48_03870, partial [SAR324 cluster bacterium]
RIVQSNYPVSISIHSAEFILLIDTPRSHPSLRRRSIQNVSYVLNRELQFQINTVEDKIELASWINWGEQFY